LRIIEFKLQIEFDGKDLCAVRNIGDYRRQFLHEIARISFVRKIELVVEKIYPDPKDNREDGDDARERQKPVRPTIESIKIVESDKIGIVFILLGPFVLILEMLENRFFFETIFSLVEMLLQNLDALVCLAGHQFPRFVLGIGGIFPAGQACPLGLPRQYEHVECKSSFQDGANL